MLELNVNWDEAKSQFQYYIGLADKIIENNKQNRDDYPKIQVAYKGLKKDTVEYLEKIFNKPNNELAREIKYLDTNKFQTGLKKQDEQLIKDKIDDLKNFKRSLEYLVNFLNKSDAIINPVIAKERTTQSLTLDQKCDLILFKLNELKDGQFHSLLSILEWNGVKIEYKGEIREIGEYLRDWDYIELLVTNDIQAQIKAGGIGYVERELKEKFDHKTRKQNNVNEEKKIFISHSSKDKGYVKELITLLRSMGVSPNQIFCSSFEGYSIELGENFLERLKDEISNDVLVLFALSKNFYESPISLCEMGAAWVMSKLHIPILIPPFQFEDMQGVFPLSQGLMLNDTKKLNSLKQKIEKHFNLIPIDQSIWEDDRDSMIEKVNSINGNGKKSNKSWGSSIA